jgi:dienelactone hydrolase
MWDSRFAADATLYAHHGVDTRWAGLVPKLVGHRFHDLPVAANACPLPVVLYSHGVPGGGRKAQSQIAEELASHGYLVVGVDHPDCWATEFPGGRYLIGNHSGDLPGRLKDMQFLLDELARLNSDDWLFTGRLNLDRIGVAGISYGGMVVEMCRRDSRVKCAAIWDGANLQLNSAGLQKPFLAAAGENNCCFSQAQWLFGKAAANATLLQIRGADHLTGSDAAWTAELPRGRGPALAFNACLVWFFDTYLKGETPLFPTNPEIYNVQKK